MTVTSSYLTEDLAQILRYFPGAQAVTFDTPFDLTPVESPKTTRAPKRAALFTTRLRPLKVQRSSPCPSH